MNRGVIFQFTMALGIQAAIFNTSGSDEHCRQPGLRRAKGGRAQAGTGEGRGIGQVGGYEVRYDIIRPVQASLFNRKKRSS